MKPERVGDYLNYILECVAFTEKYYDNKPNSLIENEVLQEAIFRKLELLCESCKRLPESVKNQIPDVEWSGIVGFRNKLAHDYMHGIDFQLIHTILTDRLPELKRAILAYQQRNPS